METRIEAESAEALSPGRRQIVGAPRDSGSVNMQKGPSDIQPTSTKRAVNLLHSSTGRAEAGGLL